ncbi:MAG: hypothetical protein ABSA83_01385 [Verrucomicrobiota bacterium]
MYIFRKYQQQIDRFICAGGRGAFFRAWVLLVVVLAVLGMLVFRVGAPAMNGCPWDTPVILDGAWRITTGQVPHRDFYDFFGDLPFYLTALGMKLGRPCVAAIDYGNVVLMAALVPPVMAVLRRRTSALPAFLFSLYIALLVITPKPLGDPYDYTDHAMMYNRHGEAFMALLGLIIFLPPRPGIAKSWADWVEAVLAGLVMVALLGCKINYFVMGIVLFGVSCVLGRTRMGWGLLCVSSAAIFLAIALALSKIPLPDLVNDYRMMSACQSPGGRIHGLVVQGVKSIIWLPVLLLLLWEGFLGETERGGHRPTPWRHIFVIAALFTGAILLISSNTQSGEMPLLALAALYGAETIQRQSNLTAETPLFVTARHLGAFLLVLLFLFPPVITDLKTLRFVADRQLKQDWYSPEALQSTSLKDFRFVRPGTRRGQTREYMEELNEGTQLMRRHANPEMRLNALLFSDPFEVALGLIPSSGGSLALTANGITKQSHPPLARLLGNATHILTMRGTNWQWFHEEMALEDIYGAEWDALHLEVVEETKNFALFKIPEEGAGQSEKARMDGQKRR